MLKATYQGEEEGENSAASTNGDEGVASETAKRAETTKGAEPNRHTRSRPEEVPSSCCSCNCGLWGHLCRHYKSLFSSQT